MIAPAHAEYEVQLGGDVRYENNIFRRSDAEIDRGGFKHSDTIFTPKAQLTVTAVPLDFDTKVDLSAGYDFYNRNSQLNNFHYLGQLRAKRDTGNVGVDVNAMIQRTLSSFGDVFARVRNVQTFEQVIGTLSYAVTSDIRLVATPQYAQSNSSNSLLKPNDFRQYGSGVGLGYYSPTGNSVAVTVSMLKTEGLNDRAFVLNGQPVNSTIDQVDKSVDVLLLYRLSELTQVDAQVSYVKRNDKSALDADYSGPSGRIAVEYSPRSSWSVRLEAGRRLSSQSYLFATAVKNDYLQLDWNIVVLDRTKISLGGLYSKRRLRYDPLFSTAGSRTDKTTTLYGTVSQPIGRQLVGLVTAGHEFRDSTSANRKYQATYISAGLRLRIGSLR